MSILADIVEGWKKKLKPDPETEQMALNRLAICIFCEKFNETKIPVFSTCKVCGCLLESKARVKNQKCPLGKW